MSNFAHYDAKGADGTLRREFNPGMPQYRFQVSRGKFSSATAVEMALENIEAAWNEAAALCADLARDIIGEMKAEPEWLLEATDEAGQPLFKFRFVAEPLARLANAEAPAE